MGPVAKKKEGGEEGLRKRKKLAVITIKFTLISSRRKKATNTKKLFQGKERDRPGEGGPCLFPNLAAKGRGKRDGIPPIASGQAEKGERKNPALLSKRRGGL